MESTNHLFALQAMIWAHLQYLYLPSSTYPVSFSHHWGEFGPPKHLLKLFRPFRVTHTETNPLGMTAGGLEDQGHIGKWFETVIKSTIVK